MPAVPRDKPADRRANFLSFTASSAYTLLFPRVRVSRGPYETDRMPRRERSLALEPCASIDDRLQDVRRLGEDRARALDKIRVEEPYLRAGIGEYLRLWLIIPLADVAVANREQ